jgi:hypothetical protein
MSQLMLQIQGCSSISLDKVAPTPWIGRPCSIPCVRAGVNFPLGSTSLRVTGFLGLSGYLETITQMRAAHVQEWIYQNLERFKASHASLETLKRACDTALVELKENVHLCKAQCLSCNLLCLQTVAMTLPMIAGLPTTVLTCVSLVMNTILVKRRNVDLGKFFPMIIIISLLTPSQCWTFRAACVCLKAFAKDATILTIPPSRCAVDIHLCGEPCKLGDKKGCQGGCTKV